MTVKDWEASASFGMKEIKHKESQVHKMKNPTCTHHKAGEKPSKTQPCMMREVGVWLLFAPGSTSREVPKGKTLTPTCKKSTTGWILKVLTMALGPYG